MCVVLQALKTAADAEEHWPHGAKFSQEATREFVRDALRKEGYNDIKINRESSDKLITKKGPSDKWSQKGPSDKW